MEETTKRFQNRVSSTPNRRRIKIISQTPTEIVANIEMDDNPTVVGTPISADVLNEWDSDVLLAKQKCVTAETNAANALAVANLADGKSDNATTLATTAGEIANEAKTIAQKAIEQVITKQGTKVTENGVVMENFNADTKVNIAQSSANKALVTDNLGNVVTSSIIPVGDMKIYQEEDDESGFSLVIEFPEQNEIIGG